MNSIPKLLSKTKLMRGYRCAKSIYLTIHRPTLEAPITPDTQALFDQGNQVGAAARNYFPGGVLIDNVPWDFTGALSRTRELLANKTEIIYEAAFEYMGCYARADIIKYSPLTQRWQIYEVKSSTKVKPEHLDDVGLQTWIMAKSGLPIEQINIMHLNPDCRYPDLSHLFKIQDVTVEMRENYLNIQPKVREIFSIIRQPDQPDLNIGAHCLAPTECGFMQHCWREKKIPAFSVLDLPGLRDRKWELYQIGIIEIDDPLLTDLNDIQERIVNTHKTGIRFIDVDSIRTEIQQWKFPLVFLDFETINPAIPRYAGTGPFQHVPFQFSVHIMDTLTSAITHKEFLHTSKSDPRPALITALLEACQGTGSIVAYYSDFEARCIQNLALYAPEQQQALESLLTRLVDPLPLIRKAIYDKAFNGSFSLKQVAPALLGSQYSYDNMAIANGSDAQRAFEKLLDSEGAAKEKLRSDMLEYCKKDTYVMVELVKWLYEQCTALTATQASIHFHSTAKHNSQRHITPER